MSKQNVRSAFEGIRSFLPQVESRRFSSVVLMATLFLFLATGVVVGQTTVNGTITGTIRDPEGRLVPGATVTLTSLDRKDERQVKSSDEGAFTLTGVTPGKYAVK